MVNTIVPRKKGAKKGAKSAKKQEDGGKVTPISELRKQRHNPMASGGTGQNYVKKAADMAELRERRRAFLSKSRVIQGKIQALKAPTKQSSPKTTSTKKGRVRKTARRASEPKKKGTLQICDVRIRAHTRKMKCRK